MLDAFEGVTYELSDDPVAVLALATSRVATRLRHGRFSSGGAGWAASRCAEAGVGGGLEENIR